MVKIAMVAGQVNPLLGHGAHAGAPPQGLHVHLAELSSALAGAGHEVVVYTRREDRDGPDRISTPGGYEVVQVPAGPPSPLRPDETASAMGEFGSFLDREWRQRPPDITHAHYWLSGLATQLATRSLGIPTVQTFHSLGTVEHRIREKTAMDASARDRIRLERLIARGATRMIATSSDEVFELARMGLPRTRTQLCRAEWTPRTTAPPPLPTPRGPASIVCSQPALSSRAPGSTSPSKRWRAFPIPNSSSLRIPLPRTCRVDPTSRRSPVS